MGGILRRRKMERMAEINLVIFYPPIKIFGLIWIVNPNSLIKEYIPEMNEKSEECGNSLY